MTNEEIVEILEAKRKRCEEMFEETGSLHRAGEALGLQEAINLLTLPHFAEEEYERFFEKGE